jgi:glycerol uptake facilitator-like aquaporin
MEYGKYLAEFFGTMFFVYIILATQNPIAIGVALALVILIGNAQVNPAVSVVYASLGKIDLNDLFPFVLLQVFGGLCALEIFKRYKM